MHLTRVYSVADRNTNAPSLDKYNVEQCLLFLIWKSSIDFNYQKREQDKTHCTHIEKYKNSSAVFIFLPKRIIAPNLI